jgi:hypothetical protein
MNKFTFYFIGLMATISLFSCEKEDNTITAAPLKNYEEQYNDEITIINNYLDSHYITVIDNRGKQNDQDVTISKKETGDTTHESILDQTKYKLETRPVLFHGIIYTVYYLVLRQGSKNSSTNRGGESPCNTDSVLAAYSGSYLKSTTENEATTVSATFFEDSKNPPLFSSLMGVIKGWSEIFPQFKTGWFSGNDSNGKISYFDFGAGVMFIPSGLAYYNFSAGSIPSYSPLVFSFKLYEIERVDTDGDGIYNFQEDIDGDGYMYSFVNKTNYPKYTGVKNVDIDIWFKDDTDQDGIPNFLDIDDDDDNYSTKIEFKKPDGTYHTFETVPNCSSEIDPLKMKRYLSKLCTPPYLD